MAAPGDAEVISISTLAAARVGPRRAAMINFAGARRRLGMTPAEFAEYLSGAVGYEVTAGHVEHWENEDAPPGEVVYAAGAADGGAIEFPASEGPRGDTVRPYSGRGLIARDQWNAIISGATRHLWLYGMAEQGYANDDAVPGILAEAAGAGCAVRVLLLDPGSPVAESVNADEGSVPGALTVRIRGALARFAAMRDACPAIGIRLYDTYPTVSIVRGDNSMLVTPYLRYFFGSNSPTFALTAESAPVMFARYERHFESMWSSSREAA